MDRKIFKIPFRKTGFTKFPCPTCGRGVLKVKKDTFQFAETKESSSAHRHEAWDPEWIEYIYSCLFECTNTVCKDSISSSGTGSVSQNYSYDEEEGNPDVDYDDIFKPKYFTPYLRLFELPKDIPESINEEIESSFSLFFSDPSSSANHIRAALEHLLTNLKIKRFTTNNGKRSYLALHKRIELLPRNFDHVKDICFAIKWLGNAGSHSHDKVTTDDVLDAYELMDELLVEIFNKNRKQVKSLANKINKKKGPK